MPRSLSMMSGTLKKIRNALLRPCMVVLNTCRDTCDLDLYFGYLRGNKFPAFLIPKGATLDKELLSLVSPDGQTIGNSPGICKNVRMGPMVGQVSSTARTIA